MINMPKNLSDLFSYESDKHNFLCDEAYMKFRLSYISEQKNTKTIDCRGFKFNLSFDKKSASCMYLIIKKNEKTFIEMNISLRTFFNDLRSLKDLVNHLDSHYYKKINHDPIFFGGAND